MWKKYFLHILIISLLVLLSSSFVHGLGCTTGSCVPAVALLSGEPDLWFNFNNTDQQIVNYGDRSIYRDLLCANTPIIGQADPFGETNAYYFDRDTSEYCFNNTKVSGLGYTGDYTVSVYINFVDLTSEQWIYDGSGSGVSTTLLAWEPTTHKWTSVLQSGERVTFNSAPSADWWMLTAKREDTNLTLFLNGTFVSQKDIGSVDALGDSDIYIGCHHDINSCIDATLADLSVWGRALTDDEILCLWDGSCEAAPPTQTMAIPTFVNPTPSDGASNNTNQSINMSCGDDVDMLYTLWFDTNVDPITLKIDNASNSNWTMDVGADDNYYYKGACYNNSGGIFSANSSIRNFTLDTTLPILTINTNNFFNTINMSTINQYLNNITSNASAIDNDNIFAFLYNITRNNVIFFNYSNTSINELSHNFSIALSTETWEDGVYDIEVAVADGHHYVGGYKIGTYKISQFINKITFDTTEGNKIKIYSSGAYSTTYEREKNSYSYGFDYLLSKTERVFEIEADHKIYYIPLSKYKAHFVVWNGIHGNWIDFEGLKGNYLVEKVNDYKYKITFNDLKKSKQIITKSIGGLNVVTQNYQWYKGNFTHDFTPIVTSESSQTFTLNLTRNINFIDNIDIDFFYNTTERTVTKTTDDNWFFFSSTFNVPKEEQVFNLEWNITVTQDDLSVYNFSINASQSVLRATLNVSILDEENQTIINTENITIFLTLEQTTQTTTDSGLASIGNLALGEYFVQGEGATYPRRGIFVTVTNQTSVINLYLLKDMAGNQDIDYFVRDTSQLNVEDARMTFQRNINGSFITMAQLETDFAGQGRVFQSQQIEYRIVLTHDAFPEKIISLRPLLNQYTIILDKLADSVYKNVWEGLRYSLIPARRVLNISQTPYEISLDIFADDSSLEYFGVFLDNHSYVCVPANCLTNISGVPAGGIATVTIKGNVTGTMDVHYFFKRSGFDLQYIHGSLYGFQLFVAFFGENLANWLDKLTDNLGGEDDSSSKLFRSVMAAFGITVLLVISAGFGIIGLPLVLVSIIGTIFFMLAGFINLFIGTLIIIEGIFILVVMMRD